MKWLTGILMSVCFNTLAADKPLQLATSVLTQGSPQQCIMIKSENCEYLKCRSPSTRSCLRDCKNEAEQNCKANSQITKRDICLNSKLRQCVEVTCFNSRQRNCTPNCLNTALSEC